MFRKLFGNSSSKQIPANLGVGEVKGDYIGCYLLWFTDNASDEPSYHSIATTLEEFEDDYTAFFSELVNMKREILESLPERDSLPEVRELPDGSSVFSAADLARNSHEQDLKIATNCLKNPSWIKRYLEGNQDRPFIQIGGMEIWIGTGVRKRNKVNGQFIE
jgi:hypothetical protein